MFYSFQTAFYLIKPEFTQFKMAATDPDTELVFHTICNIFALNFMICNSMLSKYLFISKYLSRFVWDNNYMYNLLNSKFSPKIVATVV